MGLYRRLEWSFVRYQSVERESSAMVVHSDDRADCVSPFSLSPRWLLSAFFRSPALRRPLGSLLLAHLDAIQIGSSFINVGLTVTQCCPPVIIGCESLFRRLKTRRGSFSSSSSLRRCRHHPHGHARRQVPHWIPFTHSRDVRSRR